jgi:hypothetical protein
MVSKGKVLRGFADHLISKTLVIFRLSMFSNVGVKLPMFSIVQVNFFRFSKNDSV